MSFKNWVASYSGCDGGDPVNSNIWLVGIEWGYSEPFGDRLILKDNFKKEC
jgi:hypothetical protein